MTRSSARCVLAAIFFCCAALLPLRLAAQLDDLLSSLLSGGKEGKIRAVSVASQEGDRVVLVVRYSDVRNPSSLRITARVLESKLKELDGFDVSMAEVVGAEGSVEVTLAYTGDTVVTSALVEARLVRADGRAVAVQVAPIVRRWTGTGGGSSSGEDPRADPLAEGADPGPASGTAGGAAGSPSTSPRAPRRRGSSSCTPRRFRALRRSMRLRPRHHRRHRPRLRRDRCLPTAAAGGDRSRPQRSAWWGRWSPRARCSCRWRRR